VSSDPEATLLHAECKHNTVAYFDPHRPYQSNCLKAHQLILPFFSCTSSVPFVSMRAIGS